MKKKEEVTITFYAAECGEFHDLGEYTKCRTLEEAYKKYLPSRTDETLA